MSRRAVTRPGLQATAVQLRGEAREAERQLAGAEADITAAQAAEAAGNAAVERALRQVDGLNRRFEKLTAGLAKGEDTGAPLPPPSTHTHTYLSPLRRHLRPSPKRISPCAPFDAVELYKNDCEPPRQTTPLDSVCSQRECLPLRRCRVEGGGAAGRAYGGAHPGG